MNAIDMLKQDHRMAEELFVQIEHAGDADMRQQLFIELADLLAIHATLEEQIFYQACKTEDTEALLLESLQEHLQAKRLLADLLEMDPADEVFTAKLAVLQEAIERHVEEEEIELMPQAQRLLGEDLLLALGNQMIIKRVELESSGEPRLRIRSQIDFAPALG